MKILIASSEAVPYIKTGGLGDVAGTLSLELAKAGNEVMLVLPYHQQISQMDLDLTEEISPLYVTMGSAQMFARIWKLQASENLTICFVEYDQYFGRHPIYDDGQSAYRDNGSRFAFFSKAVLDLAIAFEFQPDIVQANDWQTALIPYYLKTWNYKNDFFKDAASVLSIHNLGYQGDAPADIAQFIGLTNLQFRPEEFESYGQINLLKGGIFYADKVSTVSPTYAIEILSEPGGSGLSSFLQRRKNDVIGIINGIDTEEWNPKTDPLIPANYSWKDLSGKATCKNALQEEFGLATSPTIPVFGLVGRLADQKGLDLLRDSIEDLMKWDIQIVLLGSGDPELAEFFSGLSSRFPGKFGSFIGFEPRLAHLIEAGSDFFVMPSRYEPCGLNQMYSLHYGTLPIVRRTGGLNDTVANYNASKGEGTGFVFEDITPKALQNTIGWAADCWYNHHADYLKMQERAMKQDFSWGKTVKEYINLYQSAMHRRAKW